MSSVISEFAESPLKAEKDHRWGKGVLLKNNLFPVMSVVTLKGSTVVCLTCYLEVPEAGTSGKVSRTGVWPFYLVTRGAAIVGEDKDETRHGVGESLLSALTPAPAR